MKSPPFSYVRAESLEHALALLAGHGDEARVLAGGQSLVAALNLRLAAPALLIDINRIDALRGLREADAGASRGLGIGALNRHRDLERSARIAGEAPLLALAAPHIAHPAIRNRGTFGGSLAYADPAAEFPACVLALGATLRLASRRGTRLVAAEDFFRGLYATALERDELLVEVLVPAPEPGQRCAFGEFARRGGDYAAVGLAATASQLGARWRGARFAFFGVADRPVLAAGAARAFEAGAPGEAAIGDAQAALAGDLDPTADGQYSAAAKLHLARVLLGRVLRDLTGSAAR